jgi:6-phosphogluconate dehydrogenase
MEARKELGVVGLGRMGGGLALHGVEKKMRVVGLDKSGMDDAFAEAGVVEAKKLADFRELLAKPRVVFVYVPAGPVVDEILEDLAATLEPGDVVVDGGNSYWGDSIRRHERLQKRSIHLVDCGTSGGVEGARHGGCFMVGGDREPVGRVEPILRELAVYGGYVHAGPPGAGHFVKLVHNGIEFGMLQAIGEGVDLLEHYHEKIAVADTLRCWTNGSVIRSWLVELMEKEYRNKGGVADVPPYVEDTGEVNWLVSDALEMERPVPVIAQAVMQLFSSRDGGKGWARAIAMMRHGFGAHPYGEDSSIRKERREGRVGEIWRKPGPNESGEGG